MQASDSRTPNPLNLNSVSDQRLTPRAPIILVVEDHEDSRAMLRELLVSEGYRVTEAGDGAAGVDAAERDSPALVLMDDGLPRLSGLTAARCIHNQPNLHDLPIVILSGRDDPQRKSEAHDAGCVDFLAKPIDFARLEQILRRFCPLS